MNETEWDSPQPLGWGSEQCRHWICYYGHASDSQKWVIVISGLSKFAQWLSLDHKLTNHQPLSCFSSTWWSPRWLRLCPWLLRTRPGIRFNSFLFGLLCFGLNSPYKILCLKQNFIAVPGNADKCFKSFALHLETVVLPNFAWLPKHPGTLCSPWHIQQAEKAAEDIAQKNNTRRSWWNFFFFDGLVFKNTTLRLNWLHGEITCLVLPGLCLLYWKPKGLGVDEGLDETLTQAGEFERMMRSPLELVHLIVVVCGCSLPFWPILPQKKKIVLMEWLLLLASGCNFKSLKLWARLFLVTQQCL